MKLIKLNRIIQTYPLILLYLLGFLHWYFFLNFKNVEFNFEDWSFYYQLYSAYKESISEFKIPYHVTLFKGEQIFQINKFVYMGRFFGNPWNILSPQTLLLLWIDVKAFITFQYLFFYTLLFYGVIKFKKELKLSLTATYFVLILCAFNGKLLSQTAVGGPQMSFGYMLIPLFFWAIYRFIKKTRYLNFYDHIKDCFKIGILFFFILSQTDLHITYQMVVVSSLLVIFFPKKLFKFFLGGVISLILSLWYLLPVFSFSKESTVLVDPENWRRYGINGYGSQNGDSGKQIFEYLHFGFDAENFLYFLLNIFKAIINIFGHIYESLTKEFNITAVNSHEYNLYISSFGLLILVLSIIFIKINDNFLKNNLKKILFSFFLLFLLAVGPTHKFVILQLNKIYLFNPVDAVPSRFMIYVFYAVVIFSGLGFDNFFNKIKFASNLIKNLSILIILILLMSHSYEWWMFKTMENLNYDVNFIKDLKIYDNVEDVKYKKIVNISYIITFISLTFSLWYYHKLKYKKFDTNKIN